mmetsp:Transcript_53391/g.134086  ORF Transcript_53391/g.134086 Transcript_53391/m.134086 type:complete len:245 (-) Transcript_53391:37-771(-)|eukprot:CAMPEP_0177640440 /NCGR_PEP_ID=MMETSP0447-20121125/6543_1 /TAXON_ID=0 /ORGANISM="Stygamoeba regulata, Strain BSH-02190019" /LENGTH=244 /DNA_ID=CAMNT_0019142509 /DNA_START=49 /DNA_END=783 /DNA_ORIENTATION=-
MSSGSTSESLQFFGDSFSGDEPMTGSLSASAEFQSSAPPQPFYNQQDDFGGNAGDFGVDPNDPYAHEPPLLEELGISIPHIQRKTMAVLNPLKTIDSHILDDTDMAGPILFCVLFGTFLMMSGKLHFGYIYGFGALGCACIFVLLNLMSEQGIDFYKTVSILGYCMLPMVVLAGVSIVFTLSGPVGLCLAALTILWCTRSAATMFVQGLGLVEQKMLIIYPVGLMYVCFALLTIFEKSSIASQP